MRFGPRVVRSPSTVVSAPENGWIGVYDEDAAAAPDRLRKLASELSYVTGGVVLALGIEHGAVVRLVAFERGQPMDEYLSVPEFYGALPPGDAMALRANPTLLGRLTGADTAAIREPPRTADRLELPPADELQAELAEALGIDGAGLDFGEAEGLEGAVRWRTDDGRPPACIPTRRAHVGAAAAVLGDRHVYAPNLYDLGGSSIDGWAQQILDETEGDLVAVGASMGGYVALAMARKAPRMRSRPPARGLAPTRGLPERRAAGGDDRDHRAGGCGGALGEPRDKLLAERIPRPPWSSLVARALRDRRDLARDRGRHDALRTAVLATCRRRRPGRHLPGRRGAPRSPSRAPGRLEVIEGRVTSSTRAADEFNEILFELLRRAG